MNVKSVLFTMIRSVAQPKEHENPKQNKQVEATLSTGLKEQRMLQIPSREKATSEQPLQYIAVVQSVTK